ncbi:MAG: hypothetical protein ACFFB1_16800 [Promethearchaeota archaeon]
MKINHFLSYGLIIVLFFSSLTQFISINFQIERIRFKPNGLNQSWSIPLGFHGQDIAFDSNNCIYILGSSELIKYNSSGVPLWSIELDGFSIDYPMIKIDSSNNLYLIGYITYQGIGIFKFNSSSELQWQSIYLDGNIDYIHDIALDSEDQIYIYGHLMSSHNLFLMKYNRSGSLSWFHEFGEIGISNFGYGVLIDSDNNIIISGRSSNFSSIYWLRSYNISRDLQWSITRERQSFPFLELDSSNNVISIAGNRQLDVVKFDNSGYSVWNYTLESQFLNLEPRGGPPAPMKYRFRLTLDSSDNFYIGWTIEIPNDSYKTDVLIVKINNSGNFEEYLTWGDYHNDFLIEIGADSNDNLYLLSGYYLLSEPYYFLIKNPVSNGKSLYRTNLWNLYLILFGISCLLSLTSLYFIIRARIRKNLIK